MRYLFLDPGDDALIEMSEMPVESGIAVALRTTGYDADEDEVIALSIVDFDGNELFAKTVKPQNAEDWEASDASGGLSPADVADAPELYQFEEQISELFENAEIVVAQHLPFAKAMIEQSWVTLPDFRGFDLLEGFRKSHCTDDYRGEPAAAVAFDGVAGYYGLSNGTTLTDEARAVASAYKALVKEHADERAAKGEGYWDAHDARMAEQAADDAKAQAVAAKREKNLNRMNGLLWVAACLIFISLDIQLYQRGADVGAMIVGGAIAVFALIRAIANFRK